MLPETSILSHLIELAEKNKLFQPRELNICFNKAQAEDGFWLTKYSEEISKMPIVTGAYIFSSGPEILYIGASGKIKHSEYSKGWRLAQRLKASRGKDNQNKDVSTPVFIRQLLTKGTTDVKSYGHIHLDIKEFKITVLENYQRVPATYLEAFLLFSYYSIKEELPKLNLAF
ncbi:MAG: hypothetical protein ACK5XN_07955 [Bacteroidota bacterium]|jgi:hypothetical protein